MAKRKNKPPCECPPEGHMQGCPNDSLYRLARQAKKAQPAAGDWADKVTRDILHNPIYLRMGTALYKEIAQKIREAARADAGAPVPTLVEKRVNGRVVERILREPGEMFHKGKGDPEVTDPGELATVAREALRTAYLAARAYVDGCHAGPCQVCYGAGEIYDVGEVKHIVVGRCLACNGHGVQDCSVEGCKKC